MYASHPGLVALVTALILTTGATAEEIHFTPQPDQPGVTTSSLWETTMDLSITGSIGDAVILEMGQQKLELEQTDETVLAREEGFRKTQVSYPSCRSVEIKVSPEGTFREVVPCPVEGKTYTVVWSADDGLQVTDDAGRPVSEEEAARVKDDQDEEGDSFRDMLADKTFAFGEKLEIPDSEVQSWLGIAEEVTIEAFTIQLTGSRRVAARDLAVFAVEIQVTMADGAMTMKLDLGGELLVDPATCREVSMDLRGPATISADAPVSDTVSMHMDGTGALRIGAVVLQGSTPPAE